MFSGPSNFTGSVKEEQNTKVEPISNAEDLYYGNRYSKWYNTRFRGNNSYNTNNKDDGNQSSHLRKVSPCNKDGETTKCGVCGSIYYWIKSCPDSYENQMKIKVGTNITLIVECMDTLIGETLSMAVLDSGYTKTVWSKTWLTAT